MRRDRLRLIALGLFLAAYAICLGLIAHAHGHRAAAIEAAPDAR